MASVDEILFGSCDRDLSDRESEILRRIIQLYILKAVPVGSRTLAKYIEQEVKLSPASLRNIMSDLEELDYISHPHTSAGRIPTDKGYRFYVDTINDLASLHFPDVSDVKTSLDSSQPDSILKDASKMLGMMSKYIGLVRIPLITDFIVQKIELIPITSTRILVVIALNSNLVRTVSLEGNFEINSKYLSEISSYINDKISGKPLGFLKESFKDLISEFDKKDAPIVRLFTESLDKIFSRENTEDKIILAGTQNLLEHPEFDEPGRFKSVIELIENEDVIIHLLEQNEEPSGIKVLIGREMQNDILDDYSLVLSSYQIGSAKGSIGLIGPKRMNYPKMIRIVKSVAESLSGVGN